MKTLMTAAALTLASHAALADDIYGGFNNPDLDTRYGSHFIRAVPKTASSDVQVSLYTLYRGNPDLTTEIEGYVPRESSDGYRLTSYDTFMLDNPDASPLPRSAVMRNEYLDQRTAAAESREDGEI